MTFDEIVTQMNAAIVGVRKAIYGVEVREHIATGLENVLAVGQQVIDAVSTVKTSEGNAKASEEAAANSATAAAGSASAARTSASNAKNSEDAASTSANAASKSASAAKTSETNAEASANRAAAIVSTDKTLTVDGAPADAKAVGEALEGKLGCEDTAASVNGFVFSAQTDDPGADSELNTGNVVIVYE